MNFIKLLPQKIALLKGLTLLVIASLLLTGCGDPIKEQITQQLPVTEQRLNNLAQALESGEVRNANLIKQYSEKLKQQNGDFTPLVNEFLKDASTQGPMYRSLVDRLETAKNQPQMFASSQDLFNELVNIYQAADPVLFSDALSDPLNVLADMSGGSLPRVNSLSKTQSMQANNAQDFGTGEQLIGNPAYGQWQTGSNGMSFWAWYGMYSMVGDIFGGRRAYYGDWGRYRNYSYYNDYGRYRYSSPNDLKKQTQVENRTRKSFESKGQKFQSTYAKNRTGSSSLSGKSKSAQTSANKFQTNNKFGSKSQYARKTTSSNASLRNSRSNTTRSFRRGK
jgi:hypothetical protein